MCLNFWHCPGHGTLLIFISFLGNGSPHCAFVIESQSQHSRALAKKKFMKLKKKNFISQSVAQLNFMVKIQFQVKLLSNESIPSDRL